MARSRNLKPSFFTNEVLADIDPLGRLLFQGLWCHADREGRLEDRPKRLKAEILPYDQCDIDELLDALAARQFILRYQVEDQRFIQVLNFTKHQNPHVKEAGSLIPAPVKHSASTMRAPCKPRARPGNSGTSPADSLLPLTSSFKNTSSPLRADGASAGFAEFWKTYPRKQGKGNALKAWGRLKPDTDLQAKLISAITLQRISPDWQRDNGKFIPHPATWLNGRRWEDEPPAAQAQDASKWEGI
ncbi:MAG: hypothetical protein KGL42_07945 [Betaproteobacteria bacterium]|nr:hypothetical protein [Betaproteobacteria bacterium]